MKELLRLKQLPTAVFAANDLMALGAMVAIREANLRIPDDIALIGIDDIPAAKLIHPPLTTCSQMQEDIGHRAAEMLFERITGTVKTTDYKKRVFSSSQGNTIPYRLFIPRDYNPEIKYPLVLFYHGGGSVGSDNLANIEGPSTLEWAGPERQAKHPCFIVAPQIPGKGAGWEKDDLPFTKIMRLHIQTIHEILDALQNEFSIDTSRMYVTGLSMGGECTWVSLIERPDRFAAAVPICAGDNFIELEPSEIGQKFTQLPIWIFHGDADSVIPVDISRRLVKALQNAGGNPKYTEYPRIGHASWEIAYRDPELIEWLFAQSKKLTKSSASSNYADE